MDNIYFLSLSNIERDVRYISYKSTQRYCANIAYI